MSAFSDGLAIRAGHGSVRCHCATQPYLSEIPSMKWSLLKSSWKAERVHRLTSVRGRRGEFLTICRIVTSPGKVDAPHTSAIETELINFSAIRKHGSNHGTDATRRDAARSRPSEKASAFLGSNGVVKRSIQFDYTPSFQYTYLCFLRIGRMSSLVRVT